MYVMYYFLESTNFLKKSKMFYWPINTNYVNYVNYGKISLFRKI